MASSSGESAATVLTALHQAIAEQSRFIETSCDVDAIGRASAAKDACEELCASLASCQAHDILQELTFKTPAAASWLPASIQRLVSTPLSLGKAIAETAALLPNDPMSMPNFGALLSHVRSSRSRSRSPLVELGTPREIVTLSMQEEEHASQQSSLPAPTGAVRQRISHFNQTIEQHQQQQQQQQLLASPSVTVPGGSDSATSSLMAKQLEIEQARARLKRLEAEADELEERRSNRTGTERSRRAASDRTDRVSSRPSAAGRSSRDIHMNPLEITRPAAEQQAHQA